MTRVLLVGQAPDTVDFTDPSLPPGLDAAKIAAGIETVLRDMRVRGWEADTCPVRPDDSAGPALRAKLEAQSYDCVVIGGGLRLPPKALPLFETLVNVIHRHAPTTSIAFNTRPEDSADAAARRMAAEGRAPR